MSYHNYPPPSQYPPPQQGYYPPGPGPQHNAPPPHSQHGYPAPGQYPPPGGPPPGPPPPGPQGYGAPYPPNGPGHPQGFGGPPQQYGYQGGYAPPPPPQGFPPQPGPQPGYGGPPPFATPSAPPSPGYIPGQTAIGDFRREADALRKAMKGFGTDEKALVQVLSKLDPLQVASVRATYSSHIRRDLYADVKSETSSYFRQGLLAIIDGPLHHDAASARDAVQGAGTKEWLLNDILLGRSNADLNAIKSTYNQIYHRSIERDVDDDLSFKTKTLFSHVLRAARSDETKQVNYPALQSEAQHIHSATASRMVNNADEVSAIFARSSNNELKALSHAFQQRYHVSLETHIEKEFSGHMKDALLHMLRTALDPAMRDAINLEECMKGMGTKDERLVVRVVRVHWDRQHLANVKAAYKHKYKQDLLQRVKGETSGDYQRLLIALLE
ncbi:hypothetical protein ASPVEDRAFT_25603 [Aspergillus versicolor CBS 583.65]|uniref:Annexin n=1 Tax=Aspergillus versicolor CBS 583.65 TaxID=1036611 RepID=A0A1L9PB44_ASPVE|nr:uncharacterized protein ASPVEDRAFT_25603 [Aspergillus versicolor CBS 583.65]OJI98750.1 hypothetical protein ASPVEDRAFT_25603 [Aspergillus versicolor CBS 583.65]